MADRVSYLTPIALMVYPHFFVPKPRYEGKDPDYGVTFILNQEAQKSAEWKRIVLEGVYGAVDDRWGPGKSKDKEFMSRLRMPWRRCEEKPTMPGFTPGGIFIAPWTSGKNDPPGLVDANLQDIISPQDVWDGQLARATVTPYAYPQHGTSGNQGIGLWLNNVQITKQDMPRLSTRRNPKGDFGAIASADPSDNEMPF